MTKTTVNKPALKRSSHYKVVERRPIKREPETLVNTDSGEWIDACAEEYEGNSIREHKWNIPDVNENKENVQPNTSMME